MANHGLETLEFLTSLTFRFENLPDTVISSKDLSSSISSPVASSERVAADLDLIDGGYYLWRMVSLREGSRYSVRDRINRDDYDTSVYDFDYDLNDDDDNELVKTERTKKSEKKTLTKNVTSKKKKKSSYSQLKPGYVYAKHAWPRHQTQVLIDTFDFV